MQGLACAATICGAAAAYRRKVERSSGTCVAREDLLDEPLGKRQAFLASFARCPGGPSGTERWIPSGVTELTVRIRGAW